MWLLKYLRQVPGLEAEGESDTGSEAAADVDVEGSATEKPMPPDAVLRMLKAGNERFVRGASLTVRSTDAVKREGVNLKQPPHAVIVGCSDCQCALETIFDSLPGDIFAFKNVGNTCLHAEGSMAASLEFCVEWGCRFILVLGHSPCLAIDDATKTFFAQSPTRGDRALRSLMIGLRGVVEEATSEVPELSPAQLALKAAQVNVFHTVEMLLKMSPCIRENVRSGQLELQAAVYDAESRQVEFLGSSKKQAELLADEYDSWESDLSRSGFSGLSVDSIDRDSSAPRASSQRLLAKLREGNQRFLGGATWNKAMQRCAVPIGAVLACGDMGAPVDVIFDVEPGEIFVMRNAGNTCTHSAGSIMGSFEFSVEKFNVPLILILGHTPCAALAGAVEAHRDDEDRPSPVLLESLVAAAAQAEQQLGEGASNSQLVRRAAKLNVFHTMETILSQSRLLQLLVRQRQLDIQGAIFHKATGKVDFLGRLPHEDQLLLP